MNMYPGDGDPNFWRAQADYQGEQLRHGRPTSLLGFLAWGLIRAVVLAVWLPTRWGLRRWQRRRRARG